MARALRELRVGEEGKHHFFKYVHDNAVHQLRKNQSLEYKEIENLYLLTALGELGKEYWIDEDVLSQHMRIETDDSGNYNRVDPLNHFSITMLLLYMKDKKKYARLRMFAEDQIVLKLSAKKHYRHKDAETLMLFLDTFACPYISDATRKKAIDVYGLSPQEVSHLGSVSQNWFTSWGKFSLVDELDAKRSRDVY